jgi:hypothetical protein
MRPFDRTLPFILLSSSDSSVPSSVPAAGRMPSLIAKALHVFFPSHVDAFILTSLIHAVVFVIDFFSASWFRECCMSGLFLLGIVINKHTGHRIVAIAAIFIIHAKREIFCSYGGLTFYGALNMFINTVSQDNRLSYYGTPPLLWDKPGTRALEACLRTAIADCLLAGCGLSGCSASAEPTKAKAALQHFPFPYGLDCVSFNFLSL